MKYNAKRRAVDRMAMAMWRAEPLAAGQHPRSTDWKTEESLETRTIYRKRVRTMLRLLEVPVADMAAFLKNRNK